MRRSTSWLPIAAFSELAWSGQEASLRRQAVSFGLIILFTAAAIVTPSLAVALLANPALFLILSVYLLVPLTYAAIVGTLAGTFSRWVGLPHGAAAPPSV
jgi:hypothetical protein